MKIFLFYLTIFNHDGSTEITDLFSNAVLAKTVAQHTYIQ